MVEDGFRHHSGDSSRSMSTGLRPEYEHEHEHEHEYEYEYDSMTEGSVTFGSGRRTPAEDCATRSDSARPSESSAADAG
jgi:hypothetical protein